MKNKSGRLGRYMNHNEARKKDMSSSDRALSMGNDKWSVRDQKNVRNGQCVQNLYHQFVAMLLTA